MAAGNSQVPSNIQVRDIIKLETQVGSNKVRKVSPYQRKETIFMMEKHLCYHFRPTLCRLLVSRSLTLNLHEQ